MGVATAVAWRVVLASAVCSEALFAAVFATFFVMIFVTFFVTVSIFEKVLIFETSVRAFYL